MLSDAGTALGPEVEPCSVPRPTAAAHTQTGTAAAVVSCRGNGQYRRVCHHSHKVANYRSTVAVDDQITAAQHAAELTWLS